MIEEPGIQPLLDAIYRKRLDAFLSESLAPI